MADTNIIDLIDLIAAGLPAAVSIPGSSNAEPGNVVTPRVNPADSGQSSTAATEIGLLIAEMEAWASATPVSETVESSATKKREASDGGGGVVGEIGKALLGGLGLVSMFTGLFGGGDDTEEMAQTRFELPDAVRADLAFDSTSGEFSPVTYSAHGSARSTQTAAQVTVNVNAMDSRSFLDHSADIARAVREAMLNNHALNEVIGDL